MTPAPHWTTALSQRWKRYAVLKTVGITAFTCLFFVAYFHILRNPAYPATMMPLTALDRFIPLQPTFLIAYLSLWVYIGCAPAVLWRFSELLSYGAWVTALCITGLAIFYFWPTTIPARAPDATSFPGFALLHGIDAPGNACPSMHVAVSIYSAIWIEQLLRHVRAPRTMRVLNLLWFLAIAYSTLAVKQHVVLDVIAGAALGLVFAVLSLRFRPGRAQGPAAIIEAR